MDFLGKALNNLRVLGGKSLRGAATLGQKALNNINKGVSMVENVPVLGEAVQFLPGYGTGKKILDLSQRGLNMANQTAGVLESKTPSEAAARALGLGKTAMGARKQYQSIEKKR